MRSRHIGAVVHRTAGALYSFVLTTANLTQWAAGLATAEGVPRRGHPRRRLPRGNGARAVRAPSHFGVLDHEATLTDGRGARVAGSVRDDEL